LVADTAPERRPRSGSSARMTRRKTSAIAIATALKMTMFTVRSTAA
jgi:hypothetical protein